MFKLKIYSCINIVLYMLMYAEIRLYNSVALEARVVKSQVAVELELGPSIISSLLSVSYSIIGLPKCQTVCQSLRHSR